MEKTKKSPWFSNIDADLAKAILYNTHSSQMVMRGGGITNVFTPRTDQGKDITSHDEKAKTEKLEIAHLHKALDDANIHKDKLEYQLRHLQIKVGKLREELKLHEQSCKIKRGGGGGDKKKFREVLFIAAMNGRELYENEILKLKTNVDACIDFQQMVTVSTKKNYNEQYENKYEDEYKADDQRREQQRCNLPGMYSIKEAKANGWPWGPTMNTVLWTAAEQCIELNEKGIQKLANSEDSRDRFMNKIQCTRERLLAKYSKYVDYDFEKFY